MLRSEETKIAKEKFYTAKGLINIWDIKIDKIVIFRLIEKN